MTGYIFWIWLNIHGLGDLVTMHNDKATMLAKINKIRTEGCYCGRRWMAPVRVVKWNETLELSATLHAQDMDEHQFFGHYSHMGEDIGKRLDKVGYRWQFVGENLGEGQSTIDEVIGDWLRSRSHCRMLMNENMEEMAVIHYKKYWVQHFGSRIKG